MGFEKSSKHWKRVLPEQNSNKNAGGGRDVVYSGAEIIGTKWEPALNSVMGEYSRGERQGGISGNGWHSEKSVGQGILP